MKPIVRKIKFIGKLFDSEILKESEYKYIYQLIYRLEPETKMTETRKYYLFNLGKLKDATIEAIMDYLRSIYEIYDPFLI
jgi:hypothetical protein